MLHYLYLKMCSIVMENTKSKTAIVTGAYGAIGFAIVKGLVSRDYEVILIGRNERRLEEAVATIMVLYSNAKVWYEVVDLSRKNSIRELAHRWEGPLDLIINNAVTAPRDRLLTPEGYEVQFATNVMGYFWMMHYMHKFMKDVEDARIVNVASYWAGDLNMDDLMFEIRNYDNDKVYRQSKQADRMLSIAFAEKFKADGICVNACHPGDVSSKLSNNLGYGGHELPEKGAETPIWLACSDETKNITAKYFEDKAEKDCQFSQNKEAIELLYRFCSHLS